MKSASNILSYALVALLVFTNSASAANNYAQRIAPTGKGKAINAPDASTAEKKKTKNKLKRLTDGGFTKPFTLRKGSGTITIKFPRLRQINTLRIALGTQALPKKITLKTGDPLSSIATIDNPTLVDGRWIVINGFSTLTDRIVLSFKSSSAVKLTEVQAFGLRSDFNGDGFDDLAIGAPLHDAGSGTNGNRGKVFIYLGGPLYDTTADLEINGDEAGTQFGRAISGVGDVNGDGFSDLLVGAHGHDAGVSSSDRGRAYLYLGGATLDSTADLTFSGDSTGGNLGNNLSALGDVNGDLIDDFMIAAPYHPGGGSSRGRVYIFLGAATPSTTAALTLSGDSDNALFGFSLAGDSDLNKDGLNDLLIGASNHDAAGTQQGRAYVFLGGNTLSSTPAATLSGDEDEGKFGDGLALPGDINGDGHDDILVGASMHDAGQGSNANLGRVYLFLGGASIDTTSDLTFDGEELDGSFGRSFGVLGDINRDGFADFVIGAPFMDLNGGFASDYGQAYLYLGAATPDATADSLFAGSDDQEYFGITILRTDIFPEEGHQFAIGAPGQDSNSATDAGAIELYSFVPQNGTLTYQLDSTLRERLSGDEASGRFGALQPLII